MTLVEIGGVIYMARKSRGLIQKELAARCGISEAVLTRIENGRHVNTRSMMKVCRALGLELMVDRRSPDGSILPAGQLLQNERKQQP